MPDTTHFQDIIKTSADERADGMGYWTNSNEFHALLETLKKEGLDFVAFHTNMGLVATKYFDDMELDINNDFHMVALSIANREGVDLENLIVNGNPSIKLAEILKKIYDGFMVQNYFEDACKVIDGVPSPEEMDENPEKYTIKGMFRAVLEDRGWKEVVVEGYDDKTNRPLSSDEAQKRLDKIIKLTSSS